MDKDNFPDITPRRQLDFSEPDNADPVENNNVEKLIIGCSSTISEEKVPRIGMEFDNEDAAYNFYNEYAKVVGFGIRRHRVHKDCNGRILDRVFCCDRQGHRGKDKRDSIVKSHRPETRTGCCAEMKINGRGYGKYRVVSFEANHSGHDLATPKKIHMLNSHRRITAIQASQADDLESSRIAPRAGFTLMSKQVGGRSNVGFTMVDYKNYLRSKRTMEMQVDDTGGVLEYLQQKQIDDPNFFYAIQIDEDGLIANILWVDAQMKSDYAFFGDVVSFDTTYRKNKEGRPFALFVGVNHHKQTIVFGAALLYDETAETFVWLFDAFARAMSGKQPKTILTDQDAAMAKALAEQWPKTCHRLCIWHIFQNAATHLSHVFASFPRFSTDFSSCIYDYEEEDEFIEAWNQMLERYGLQTNEWLGRLFKIREKWALVYGRQSFCADMTTTQRSESMNSVLKRYVSNKNNLLQFFNHFDGLVEDRRYEELKSDFWTTHSTPVISFPVQILVHASSIYTHEVFGKFREEVRKGYDAKIELCGETGEISEYNVTNLGKRYPHTVRFQSSQGTASCSCHKFEFAGILCSHILKVFAWRNIVEIPEFYVMKRWTKKAKNNDVRAQSAEASGGPPDPANQNDEKKMIGTHYKELCNLSHQLVTRAALTTETFEIVREGLMRLIEEVDASLENRASATLTARLKVDSHKALSSKVVNQKKFVSEVCETTSGTKDVKSASEIMVRGWKPKEKKLARSGRRLKSGLEKKNQRKKQSSTREVENNDKIPYTDYGTISSNIGAPLECNSSHALSQLPQGNPTVRSNIRMNYPGEGSSLTHVQSFQFPPIFNGNVHGHVNVAPHIPIIDNQIGISLTQLLQQQVNRGRGFEGVQSNTCVYEGRHEEANNKYDDASKG